MSDDYLFAICELCGELKKLEWVVKDGEYDDCEDIAKPIPDTSLGSDVKDEVAEATDVKNEVSEASAVKDEVSEATDVKDEVSEATDVKDEVAEVTDVKN